MTTSTKRELLLAIIDNPGTDPGSSRQTHEWADELVNEGWLEEAMGGFVPTAKALDEHPHFISQTDIADLSAPVFVKPESEFVQQATPQVTDNVRDRLAMLFICLLSNDITLGAAYKAVALAPQLEVHEAAVETQLCRELADRMLQGLPEPERFFGPVDGPAPDPATWSCRIGEIPRDKLGGGLDAPMRDAVERAYREVTGEEPKFVFSGWGGGLSPGERAVVEEDDHADA